MNSIILVLLALIVCGGAPIIVGYIEDKLSKRTEAFTEDELNGSKKDETDNE